MSELVDQFVQVVSPDAASADEGLGNERGKRGQARPGHRLPRLPLESALEHGKLEENPLFFLRKQSPRMIEDRAHGTVTSGKVPGRYGKEVQPALDLPRDFVTGESSHPGRGEFEPQRHATDPPAGGDEGGGVVRGWAEAHVGAGGG